jgi:proteasome activator subunit 4
LIPHYLHNAMQVQSQIMWFSELCVSDLIHDEITETASWHTKCRVLPMLQVLYFTHLFSISPTLKNEVMNLLLFLIQDSHVQVFFNSCRFVRWPNKRYPV